MRDFREFFQYNKVNYTNEYAQTLKTLEVQIKRIVTEPDPYSYFKPTVKGTRAHRNCKEQIYKLAGQLAIKHQLSGNMISLGAAYALEIYKEFSNCITNRFINVEKDKKSYLSLSRYYYDLRNGNCFDSLVANLSDDQKRTLDKVFLMRADIFNVLEMKRARELAIVDLDLMQVLTPELIDKTYRSLEGSEVHTDRFLLAVWSTYGRSCTEAEYDSSARPYLIQRFVLDPSTRYNLIDYETYKYCDNHIPLKVELLVLENKKNAR